MPRIARLIGGAGTGKTTELLRIMELLIGRGVEPGQIGFVSFTRAARAEAVQRAASQFSVDPKRLEQDGWFRTLHSVCYRCLEEGRGELLAGDKESRQWMSEAVGEDVTPTDREADQDFSEAFEGQSDASSALRLWSSARNRLTSLKDAWERSALCDDRTPDYAYCEQIVDRYELHKRIDHRVDFPDLAGRFAGWKFFTEGAERAEPEGYVPALPVWFFDEQQDASPLLDSVCHRLIGTPQCKWVYVSADPYQSIYGFAGADPKCFMRWKATKERIMPKSYRCPEAVLTLGEETLQGCTDYFDRGIAPADHEGSVDYAWFAPSIFDIDPTESWLLIARTNFHVRRLTTGLERAGIPWSPTKGLGGWNAPKKNKSLSDLLCLERGYPISSEEWREAIALVPSRFEGAPLLKRGAKKQWCDSEFRPAEQLHKAETLDRWGATENLIELIQSGRWRSAVQGAERFCEAADRWGLEAVQESKVKAGTIHSVKGAEAENVLMLTTASLPVQRSMETDEGMNEELRCSYVGITRAKKRLLIVRERNAAFQMKVGA